MAWASHGRRCLRDAVRAARGGACANRRAGLNVVGPPRSFPLPSLHPLIQRRERAVRVRALAAPLAALAAAQPPRQPAAAQPAPQPALAPQPTRPRLQLRRLLRGKPCSVIQQSLCC